MTNLQNINIVDLLPSNLQNDKITALGYALNQAMGRLCSYADSVRMMALIDDMPENIIDFLAVELRAQYYVETLDLDIKKDIVKKTLQRYQKTGTPAIIIDYLESLSGSGMVEIKEWFEYSGDPYHFSVYMTVPHDTVIDEAFIADVEQKIANLKNARSILDVVNIIKQFEDDTSMYLGTGSYLQIEGSLGESNDVTAVGGDAIVLVDGQGRMLCAGNKILIIREE